jgi:hypothetical protein
LREDDPMSSEPHERNDLYENELTEECDATPEEREDVAHDLVLDPDEPDDYSSPSANASMRLLP